MLAISPLNVATHIIDVAEHFAKAEGIELTSYYEYIKSHAVHAFNGVEEREGKWYSIRVVVFLDKKGNISAEVPRSNQKPFGHSTRVEAIY